LLNYKEIESVRKISNYLGCSNPVRKLNSMEPEQISYNKSYRNSIADNNNEQTKNVQLGKILDTILTANEPQIAIETLKATINCLIGKSLENQNLDLPINVKKAIEFITANSNNHWFTNSQAITRGAVQILFAACYKIALENHMLRPENLSSRASKIQLVNQVINDCINKKDFPDLPKVKGLIKFSNESYFDRSTINEEGMLSVSGKGYNYTQPKPGKLLFNENINNYIDPQGSSDSSFNSYGKIANEEDFEIINNNSSVIDKKEEPFLEQSELNRKTSGKLTGIEIFSIINSGLEQQNEVGQDTVINQNNRRVIINPFVTGADEINKLLKNDKLYNNDNNILTLIPYGVTNRGRLHENHSVLIAIYKDCVFVIDPKNKSSSQITAIPHKVISPKWQSTFDATNCGRYTSYTAIQLAKQFLNNNSEDFNIPQRLREIQHPKIDQLQREYVSMLTQGQQYSG